MSSVTIKPVQPVSVERVPIETLPAPVEPVPIKPVPVTAITMSRDVDPLALIVSGSQADFPTTDVSVSDIAIVERRLSAKPEGSVSLLDTIRDPSEALSRAELAQACLDRCARDFESFTEQGFLLWQYVAHYKLWESHPDPSMRDPLGFFRGLEDPKGVRCMLALGSTTQAARHRCLQKIGAAWGLSWYTHVPNCVRPEKDGVTVASPDAMSKPMLEAIASHCSHTPMDEAIEGWGFAIEARAGGLARQASRQRRTQTLTTKDVVTAAREARQRRLAPPPAPPEEEVGEPQAAKRSTRAPAGQGVARKRAKHQNEGFENRVRSDDGQRWIWRSGGHPTSCAVKPGEKSPHRQPSSPEPEGDEHIQAESRAYFRPVNPRPASRAVTEFEPNQDEEAAMASLIALSRDRRSAERLDGPEAETTVSRPSAARPSTPVLTEAREPRSTLTISPLTEEDPSQPVAKGPRKRPSSSRVVTESDGEGETITARQSQRASTQQVPCSGMASARVRKIKAWLSGKSLPGATLMLHPLEESDKRCAECVRVLKSAVDGLAGVA